ncbi:unnamed protein product [Aureobasidium vineae]|uniref:Amino acid transporter n=1 Tax=Aureobasidium vineae TaxID=2773715 RepID=A0A9N8JFK5_9PEZI|nr:unnamed protein product [Aureobasidium vineae]
MVFTMITAAVLAEICSALPAAGSIYFWAAEAGGPRYARLFGFIVAWWSCTAWTTFVASLCQSTANFILSELPVFGVTSLITDTGDIKFRAVQWAVSEGILFLAIGMNYLNPKTYKWIFRIASGLICLDFILNIIWFPIAVSQTYGFQSAKFAFTATENLTGAPPVWNWMLSYYVTAGILVGFEASGHISEETQNANVVAAKGIFTSALVSALMGFPMVILFLFCCPDLSKFNFDYPQPFVGIYAQAMGKGGHLVMNIVCILGLFFNTTVSGVASSRLIWAVARDGVLPFSGWISAVSAKKEPRNAVTVMLVVAALLLCSILPSATAFASLVSAAGVPTITAYALICFGRTFLTPGEFKNAPWSLGRWSRPLNFIALIWNLYLAAVLFSPLEFPVTGPTFNYSPVIFGAITIFALLSWWFMPEDKWLPAARLGKVHEFEEELNANRTGRSSSVSGPSS